MNFLLTLACHVLNLKAYVTLKLPFSSSTCYTVSAQRSATFKMFRMSEQNVINGKIMLTKYTRQSLITWINSF